MTKNFWSDKKVLVTGGTGFLGKHLVEKLKKRKPAKLTLTDSKKDDLRIVENCKRVVRGQDIVIHLAGVVGGIGFNRENPATLFYDNAVMGVHLIEEARLANVKKFVNLLTICSYPKFTPVPFMEENLWNGYPEETNAAYGLAKKMLLVQGQAYWQQYGFRSIHLMPVNLYGPGDKFDPEKSHVIPALIKKFIDAKRDNLRKVIIWGTGKATREFLYVEDVAKAIVLATKYYNKPDPVNLGSSFEISISKLAQLIGDLIGFKGKIVFDVTKPDGQLRRKLDVSKAEKEFGFVSTTPFEKGLKKTIEWYLKSKI